MFINFNKCSSLIGRHWYSASWVMTSKGACHCGPDVIQKLDAGREESGIKSLVFVQQLLANANLERERVFAAKRSIFFQKLFMISISIKSILIHKIMFIMFDCQQISLDVKGTQKQRDSKIGKLLASGFRFRS